MTALNSIREAEHRIGDWIAKWCERLVQWQPVLMLYVAVMATIFFVVMWRTG